MSQLNSPPLGNRFSDICLGEFEHQDIDFDSQCLTEFDGQTTCIHNLLASTLTGKVDKEVDVTVILRCTCGH